MRNEILDDRAWQKFMTKLVNNVLKMEENLLIFPHDFFIYGIY